jgi:hypothetical protein
MNAYVMLGCKVDACLLFRENKQRSCDHAVDSAASYCFVCGKPVWETEPEPIFDELQGVYAGRIGQFDVVIPVSDWQWIDDADDAHIGIVILDENRTGMKVPLDDTDAIRAELQQTLEPLGLWDATRFGLWLVFVDDD